jgi:hypothetical protein
MLATVAVGDPNANLGNRGVFQPSASRTFELGTSTSPWGPLYSGYTGTIAHDTVRVGDISLPKHEIRAFRPSPHLY